MSSCLPTTWIPQLTCSCACLITFVRPSTVFVFRMRFRVNRRLQYVPLEVLPHAYHLLSTQV